jgi:polysaccharide biosynthesis transport protein
MVQNPQEQPTRTLADYFAIGRRRLWWILLPTFFCWAVVWAFSWFVPVTYQSEAMILVEQQRVPEQYVVPNFNLNAEARLQSITQEILSRTRLQSIIDRFHLYSHRNWLTTLLHRGGDAVELMRKDVEVDPVEAQTPDHPDELTAFKIYYTAETPELAQEVNRELTSLFIAENLRSQQQLSESTTAFLSSQLSDAKAKLELQEARVQAFKAKHMGELPDQLQSNVQILSGLQQQLENVSESLDRAQQQKLYLESLIQQYQAAKGQLGAADSAVSPSALDQQLKDMRLKLAQLRSQYTDNYPDVIALKDQIAKTEKLKQQLDKQTTKAQTPAKSPSELAPGAATALESGAPTSMMQIESQLKANQLETESYHGEKKDLEARIASYQERLNLIPATEQQLADISRGYKESEANYNSLLQKQNQSQLATSLEQRQQGEHFQLIDPPSLPRRPAKPSRLMASIAGLAFGLAIGAGLAIFLEVSDARLYKEKDLEALVPVRVLVGIPRLSTPAEDQRRLLLGWLEGIAAAFLVFAIAAGNFLSLYSYFKG